MPEMRDAVREWKRLLGLKQDLSPVRFALSGDGSSATTSDVDGRPGWAWVRYDEEQNKVSQVRNRKMPGVPQDVPVVIGKEFPTDRYVQILGVNWPLYDMFITDPSLISYLTPPHGDSHHAIFGNDPAYIDVRNILNGRVRPTIPESMAVYIESFAYEYMDERELFGGDGEDLNGFIPGVADTHRYVVVSMDTIAQEIEVTGGPENPLAMPALLPDVPIWHIPLGAVLMYEGMTEVTEQDIFDMRIVFNPTGTYNIYRNMIQELYEQELLWTKHLAGDI